MRRSYSQEKDIDRFSLPLWHVVIMEELLVYKAGLIIYFSSRISAWSLVLITSIDNTKLAWDQGEQWKDREEMLSTLSLCKENPSMLRFPRGAEKGHLPLCMNNSPIASKLEF